MLLRAAVAATITGYQRYVSPYKGYRCAHAALHGGDTCSVRGRRIVLRVGLFAFFPLMLRRFRACAVAHRMLLVTQNMDPDGSPAKPEKKTAAGSSTDNALAGVAAEAGVECCMGCASIPF